MTSAHLIAAILGVVFSLSIVFLVRRDHISPKVAIRWFLISFFILVLGLMPGLVDRVGEYLGIGYPPILPVLVAICAALIKILLMDIERQKVQTTVERLVQKVAILNREIEELREKNTENG